MEIEDERLKSLVSESVMYSTRLLDLFCQISEETPYFNPAVIISSISRFSSAVIAATIRHYCNENDLPFEEMKKDILNDFMSLFTKLFNEQIDVLENDSKKYN